MNAGYRMVLPASWARLPANPIALRPVVRRLLLDLWADQPRDQTARRRRQLEQQLVELGNQAADGGGRELLVCLQTAGDVTLAASAVVSLHPTLVQGDECLQQLAETNRLTAASSEVINLGRNRGLLVIRDCLVEDALPVPDTATHEQREALADAVRSTRQVDVHLPVPDEPAMLLLSFSTPVAPLFDAFTELFVALASTVQWRADQTWT